MISSENEIVLVACKIHTKNALEQRDCKWIMGHSPSLNVLKSNAYMLKHSTRLNLKTRHKGFSVDEGLQPKLPDSAKVPLILTGFFEIPWG